MHVLLFGHLRFQLREHFLGSFLLRYNWRRWGSTVHLQEVSKSHVLCRVEISGVDGFVNELNLFFFLFVWEQSSKDGEWLLGVVDRLGRAVAGDELIVATEWSVSFVFEKLDLIVHVMKVLIILFGRQLRIFWSLSKFTSCSTLSSGTVIAEKGVPRDRLALYVGRNRLFNGRRNISVWTNWSFTFIGHFQLSWCDLRPATMRIWSWLLSLLQIFSHGLVIKCLQLIALHRVQLLCAQLRLQFIQMYILPPVGLVLINGHPCQLIIQRIIASHLLHPFVLLLHLHLLITRQLLTFHLTHRLVWLLVYIMYHFTKTNGPSEVLIKQINIAIIVHLRITLLSITNRLFIIIKIWCLCLNVFCFDVSYFFMVTRDNALWDAVR